MINIRNAQLEDATAISKVHVDSWRTTYKGIVPERYLNNLSYEKREELWIRNIKDENNYILVAEGPNGEIVGFATASCDNEKVSDSINLTSIYILETYHGRGIGKLLLMNIFERFIKLGYVSCYVEVLADNKARFFYEHYGAKLVRTTNVEISGEQLQECIYKWDSIEEGLKLMK